jgi:hypothetical protein
MICHTFFALYRRRMDETFSKNRVTNSKNSHYLQSLMRAFYVEY